MKVKVMAFGNLTELLQREEFYLYSVRDTDSLRQYLQLQYPTLHTIVYAIAVDEIMVNTNTPLYENATVALLPPYSGG